MYVPDKKFIVYKKVIIIYNVCYFIIINTTKH